MWNNTKRVILSSLKLQMKQTFARSMFRYVIIVSPILSGILMGLIYSGKSSSEFVSFAIIGTATMTMWSSIAFSSAGDIERERYMGALQQIFNTPPNFYNIMLGKILGNTILGFLSMIFSFLFMSIVFQVPLKIESPIIFFAIFLIGIISYMIVAQMLSGLLALSRKTRVFMNSIGNIIYILTGSVFPIFILPKGVQMISYLLTPTYVIHLMRLCIKGDIFTFEFNIYFLGLIITTLIYLILSIKFYKIIEIKVRAEGTLEVV